jgi:4'-phosphopantetheinyl transferase
LNQIIFCALGEQWPQSEFENSLAMLSVGEQQHITRFQQWQDRQRSLLGKLMLRMILKNFNISPLDDLFYDQYERPFQRQKERVDFNIAHSGNWIVCGACDSGRIGVDVERVHPIEMDIAKQYFATKEVAFLLEQPQDERLHCFYRFWTLKEAYIKAKGSTFLIPLDQFWFDLQNESNPSFHLKEWQDQKEWTFHSLKLDTEHIFSACMPANERQIKINFETLSSIVSSLI